MIRNQLILPIAEEIIVDLFAGGGGMSTAIEQALGRHVDIAINHDEDAISMHMVNHPQTRHYCSDVFEVCPRDATQGRPVGHLHGSPDCTHHSQAAGGQPRSKKIRGLGWVMVRWAGQVAPRSISLENVKQMQQWGPLIAKRCPKTGRVVTLDMVSCPITGRMVNRVADIGERVPVQMQYLVPDPKRAGRTWRRYIKVFESLGYHIEWRILTAANYGAATTRERLFMFARRDGKQIYWPAPTHHANPDPKQRGWRPAAEHIDFSDLGQSIFLRKKDLAVATMRRIAKGMRKYVLNDPQPFIVPIANWSGESVQPSSEPLRTITAWPRGGSFAVATPSLVPLTQLKLGNGEHKETPALAMDRGRQTRNLASAYLMQANGGFNQTIGRSLKEPATTLTTTGSQQQLVAAHLAQLRKNCDGRNVNEPLRTLSAGGEHHALVTYQLSKDDEERALRVAAFLFQYDDVAKHSACNGPLQDASIMDRLASVTVWLNGEPWLIVDISLRMLKSPELYGCQGLPKHYIIEHGHDGRKFSKEAQVRMVGNSVSPMPAAALMKANCMDLAAWTMQELRMKEKAVA